MNLPKSRLVHQLKLPVQPMVEDPAVSVTKVFLGLIDRIMLANTFSVRFEAFTRTIL
jgi:hypothetical protein